MTKSEGLVQSTEIWKLGQIPDGMMRTHCLAGLLSAEAAETGGNLLGGWVWRSLDVTFSTQAWEECISQSQGPELERTPGILSRKVSHTASQIFARSVEGPRGFLSWNHTQNNTEQLSLRSPHWSFAGNKKLKLLCHHCLNIQDST